MGIAAFDIGDTALKMGGAIRRFDNFAMKTWLM